MPRALAAILLAVVVAGMCALAASAASAGVVSQAEHLSVHAKGLTEPERRALTLRSITATADDSLGLIVTATFAGNVERYLGQGSLKGGLVALALVPRSPRATPAGLADEGGGYVAPRVPMLIRSGPRSAVLARSIGVFSPEQVLHVRTPPQAGVIRSGNQIVFYLGRAGLSQITRIKLKVFSAGPVLPGGGSTAALWRAILKAPATEAASLYLDHTRMPYFALPAPRQALAALQASAVTLELGRQQQAATMLQASIHHYATVARAIKKRRTLPKASRSVLAVDLARMSARVSRLKGENSALTRLLGEIDALIKARTPPPVQVVQTDGGLSQEMAPQPQIPFSGPPPAGMPVVEVNDQLRYQQFAGLGAAMTDSSAWLIGTNMSAAQRAALMQELFGPPNSGSGLSAPPIHLNFLRVGIAATGAMTTGAPYSYDDNNNQADPGLANFSISHDTPYIIPTLQQALQVNPKLEILGSPWSPPAWMKTNDSLGNSNASGSLMPVYYSTYAQYIVKFLQAYAQAGVPVNAITPANEPTSGTGGMSYPGMNFPEPNEASFISGYLQPALTAANLHPKLYGSDLSWDQFSNYASPLAADPTAGPDLTGIAWHCYFGTPSVMTQLQQQAPRLDQIVDECSPEIRSFGTPEFLISSLRNWATVAAIWSVALEPNGQPVQAGNACGGCRGIVSIDPTTGNVTFRSEYYQLGQVSAFVQPGATRIDSPSFVTYGTNSSNIETVSPGLDDVAFLNPDGSKVLIAYNNSSAPISFAVASDGGYYTYTIPAQAMTTFTWR